MDSNGFQKDSVGKIQVKPLQKTGETKRMFERKRGGKKERRQREREREREREMKRIKRSRL